MFWPVGLLQWEMKYYWVHYSSFSYPRCCFVLTRLLLLNFFYSWWSRAPLWQVGSFAESIGMGPGLATAKVCFRMRFNGLVLHLWELSAIVGGARGSTIIERFISVSFSSLSMYLLFVFIETSSLLLINWCFHLLLWWFWYPWVAIDSLVIKLTQGAGVEWYSIAYHVVKKTHRSKYLGLWTNLMYYSLYYTMFYYPIINLLSSFNSV